MPPPISARRSTHSLRSSSFMPTATMLCASCATVGATAQAEAADEAEADAAGGVVALDDRDLREVALRVGHDLAAAHARYEREVLAQDLIPDQPDRPYPLARVWQPERVV